MTDIIMTDFSSGELKTNYWQSEAANNGIAYCAVHDKAFHILLPNIALRGGQATAEVIAEMMTGRKVVITIEKLGVNFMFDDDTETPYRLFLDNRQFSTLPAQSDGGRKDVKVAVHTPDGEKFEWKAEIDKFCRL